MFNKAIIAGALGQDVELRYTQSGMAVANMSVACTTSEKIKDKWEDVVFWASVVVWGKQAESCSQYLSKGSKVLIEGKLQTRTWDKDGVKQYKTEIVARDVKFLGSKQDGSSQSSGQSSGQSSQPDEISDVEPF